MIGHPKLPGGRLLGPLDLDLKEKMTKARTTGTKERIKRKAAMIKTGICGGT
jgi:hypothetical protein